LKNERTALRLADAINREQFLKLCDFFAEFAGARTYFQNRYIPAAEQLRLKKEICAKRFRGRGNHVGWRDRGTFRRTIGYRNARSGP